MKDKQKHINLIQEWDEKREGTNFVGLLKSIRIADGKREFSIAPVNTSSIQPIAKEFEGNMNDVYMIHMLIPKKIELSEVKDFEEVSFQTRVEELNIKESPTMKGKIPRDAVNQLNDLLFEWSEEVRFSFLRIRQQMEFGDDSKDFADE